MKSDPHRTSAWEILARRQALKKKFGTLYDEVLAIITRHDPIGIADVPDKYEPEVETILPLLEQAQSKSELRRIVYQEFVHWFGAQVAGPEPDYDKVAGEIWDAWQGRRLGFQQH